MLKEMMIEPMKANNPPKRKGKTKDEVLMDICKSGEYFAHIKEDGAWYQFITDSEYCALYSRAISKETGFYSEKSGHVPHIKKHLMRVLPANTIVVGEIYYPNGSSSKTTEIMGCLEEKALDRQRMGYHGPIHYYIFDVLMWNGEDLLTKTNE